MVKIHAWALNSKFCLGGSFLLVIGVHGTVVEEHTCVCGFVFILMPNTQCLLFCRWYYMYVVNHMQPELFGMIVKYTKLIHTVQLHEQLKIHIVVKEDTVN